MTKNPAFPLRNASRMRPRNAAIVGTGLYAPERVVPNAWFNEKYGIDIDSFLRAKRNIFERRYMREDQATSDLIVPAAENALKSAGITAADLDLIIVATDTPDYLSPSTAAVVQHKLQATRAGTFDVNAACAGFVSALAVGSHFIRGDERMRHVLVVGAYGMSKFLNWEDHKIASLFADGAGAVVLRPTEDLEMGILETQFHTLGQFHDYMGLYAGGTHAPLSQSVLDQKQHLLNFAKKIPIETNGTHWPRLVGILCDRLGATPAEVKRYFFTQINIQSIHETLDHLGLPHAASHNIMDRFGYTGSAAIPMAIADAHAKGLLKAGDLLLSVGSGGGVSMASVAFRWAISSG